MAARGLARPHRQSGAETALWLLRLPAHRRHRRRADLAGVGLCALPGDRGLSGVRAGRSEEHTSELQSLMRISYAVFCLKKKTTKIITTNKTSTEYRSNNESHISQTTIHST